MTDFFSVKGFNVVITGANGYLGREQVVAFAKSGANVLAICRHSELLEKRIGEEAYSGKIEIAYADCNNEIEIRTAISRFVNLFGRLNGLINNAYASSRRPGFDMEIQKISEILQNSFIQYWTTIRASKPFLNENGASIVNNGSLWGIVSPNIDMYLDLENEPSIALVSAKAAVHQLTKYLSVIFAKENIRVNTIVPGMIPQNRPPERLDYMKELFDRIPMKRIGKPIEVALPIMFLISNGSSYMTGQELIIDGGFTTL